MSTPAYVDSETITLADGAQSSRVHVLLPDDPYVAVMKSQLVDTKSEPDEAPLEADELQLLGFKVPLMGEEFEAFEPSGTRTDSSHSSASSDSTAPLSPDHSLTQISPTPTPTRAPFHHRTAIMTVRIQPAMSPGHLARVAKAMALSDLVFRKRYISSYETPSPSPALLGNDEEVVPEGQYQPAPAADTAVGEPLGLGYEASRRRELAVEEDQILRMAEFTSTYRLIPVAPVQTPSSPEWSSSSLPISPSSTVVSSPIAFTSGYPNSHHLGQERFEMRSSHRGPSDTPWCYLCTCEKCGNILIDGTCSKCNSRAGNSFTYDPIPKSFNEVQNIFNPHPQPHYNIYLCQICESNSHYGYECSQRVPLVYEPEPCYNQIFGDNAYPHDSPGVTPLIDHHCCYKYGDSLDGFFCHQCTCEFCGNGAHDGYNYPSHVPFVKTLPSFPQQYLYCEDCGGPHETFQSIAITLDLPTVEPENSLRMGDKHIDTIPETESDEFIKSSVENLIGSLLDEFADELILLKSIPPGIDEADCDPEEEIRLINILLYDNSSPRIEDDDYVSERNILIIEELLSNDSLLFPENKSFHFDIPSSPRPPAKPPDDDEIKPKSRILTVKVVGDISEQYVPFPRLLPTQPTLASNQEKSPHILSHRGLKAFQLSSECPMMIYRGNIPILDVSFLHFYAP
nr:hypothetical protein [Tanacetum cinerariifolium]